MDRRLVLLPALVAFLVGAAPATAWTWPVDGPVVRHFELGGDPYAAGQHRGVDIGAASGTPVSAPAAGRVAFVGTVPRAGKTVTIETPDGYSVTLVHLGSILVARNAWLVEGETVGTVGATGDVEHPEPSVHLGVRLATDPNGYLDPLGFLPPRTEGTAGTAAGAQQEPAGAAAAGGELAAPQPAGNGGESTSSSDDAAPSPAPVAPEEPEVAPSPSQPAAAPAPAPPPASAAADVAAPSPGAEASQTPVTVAGVEAGAELTAPSAADEAEDGGSGAATTLTAAATAVAASGDASASKTFELPRASGRAPTPDTTRARTTGSGSVPQPPRAAGATAPVAGAVEAPRSTGDEGAAGTPPIGGGTGRDGSPAWTLLLSACVVALGTLMLRRRPDPGVRGDPSAPGPAPVPTSGGQESATPERRAARLESLDDLARAA
jgi:hypothetical protein